MYMAVKDFLVGQPARLEQVERYSPEQLSAQKQILQSALQGISQPYAGFEPIEQRARSQFMQQTVPTLSERFTSLGGYGTGALSSPVFASQLGSAGAGLEEGLAALRAQYGLQQRGLAQGLLPYGLQPRYENLFMGGQSGLAQEIIPLLSRLATMLGASYLTGGASSIGSALGLLS